MPDESKLTKKQLKALKHRSGASRAERKASKAKILEEIGLPDQDPETNDAVTVEDGKNDRKKRKRKEESDDAKPVSKKTKKTKAGGAATPDANDANTKATESKAAESKKRFVCFCGNLSYNTTAEDLKKHFTFEEHIPTIRLATQKGDGPQSAKSKGYAFIEFSAAPALQNALKLHHSLLSNRKINVELSAGGGGNSESRKAKIADHNKKLKQQREKMAGKVAEKIKKEKDAKANRPAPVEVPRQEKKVKMPWLLSGGNAIKLG